MVVEYAVARAAREIKGFEGFEDGGFGVVWLRFVGLGGGGEGLLVFRLHSIPTGIAGVVQGFYFPSLFCLAALIDGLCNPENLYQGFLQSNNGIRDQFLNHAWILAV